MLAERLKLIRQARGMALDDLSAAAGRVVTKQAISKYERGLDVPSAKVLVALAKALGVPTHSLLTGSGVQIRKLHYRRKARMKKRDQYRFESCLELKLEQSIRVRELVDPAYRFEVPVRSRAVSSVEDAEAVALWLRKHWSMGLDPISNVVDLLEDKGIAVCFVESEVGFDGLSAVAYNEKGRPRGAAVMCRTDIPRERQRLNLIHELAHVVLDPPADLEEDCAWRFASAFLAPRETLLADIGTSRRAIGLQELILLKRRYGVSIAALLMRLRSLNVLTADTLKSSFIALNRLGIRKTEPGDRAEQEEPQWLRRNVLRAVSEGLLTASEATDVLGETVSPPARRPSLARTLAAMPVEQRLEWLGTPDPSEDETELEDWDSIEHDDEANP